MFLVYFFILLIVFTVHKTKSEDQSSVWSNFLVADKNELAKCKRCGQILKTKGGSTKGLHVHLKQHGITILKKKSNETVDTPPVKQTKIINFFQNNKDKSLPAVLARMTAVDGLSFSTFVKSEDLRQLMISSGFEMPKSINTIKDMVMKYSLKVEESLVEQFLSLKKNGQKFSLVFDEWTSTSNKHFLNISVFSESENWNLGLVRYKCSMSAEICIKMLDERLKHFKLDFDDIVSVTTDGASMMVKLGKMIKPYHQLCFAHGLQLAVVDVLYKAVSNSSAHREHIIFLILFVF